MSLTATDPACQGYPQVRVPGQRVDGLRRWRLADRLSAECSDSASRHSPVQTPERLRLAAGDTFGSAGPGRPGTPRSAPAAAPPAWRSPEQERPGRRVHRGRQRERQQQAGRVETPKPAASNSIGCGSSGGTSRCLWDDVLGVAGLVDAVTLLGEEVARVVGEVDVAGDGG